MSDNSDDELIVVEKKFTKRNVYEKEQQQVLNKILNILDLEPDNASDSIVKDEMEKKYEDIAKLMDAVKTYYDLSVMSNIKRAACKELSLIRSVLKYHKYELKTKQAYFMRNNKNVHSTAYYIVSQ